MRKGREVPKFVKGAMLFLLGGGCYAGLEVLYQGGTHWSMAVLGGGLFLLIGGMDSWSRVPVPLLAQGILGGLLITAAELAAGLLLNRELGWNVWNYSAMPGNLLGQVCPAFSLLWGLLTIVAVFLDDYLRCRLFGERMPALRMI
ncbi:MAG: putative ABC transporter permease [Oscillospiraceae bacterium]|nr:putative ABC transporter permease [Oscillospiraceae bacterium]